MTTAKKPVSEAQKKHLEKAREERNKHQALLSEIDRQKGQLEGIKDVWHDKGLSFTRRGNQLQMLRNTWPELYKKLEAEFGTPTVR